MAEFEVKSGIDDWIDRHPPHIVVQALAPHLTAERKARIESVLDARLSGLSVVLENLHDPHNGAAVLRSTEAHGVTTLHVVEQAEPFAFSPRVTQGCEKWLELRRYPDFQACAAALHAGGVRLYAAIPGGDLGLDEIDVTQRAALVFGNEHAGLTGAAQAACDGSFGIPMHGFTRSFNLSVSVAITLYETSRRRRLALGRETDLTDEERARFRARWYALSLDDRGAQALVDRHVSQ